MRNKIVRKCYLLSFNHHLTVARLRPSSLLHFPRQDSKFQSRRSFLRQFHAQFERRSDTEFYANVCLFGRSTLPHYIKFCSSIHVTLSLFPCWIWISNYFKKAEWINVFPCDVWTLLRALGSTHLSVNQSNNDLFLLAFYFLKQNRTQKNENDAQCPNPSVLDNNLPLRVS